jgi:predicted O-linked N-acetylglucosamine transferase (SPINDLY family)
MNQHPVSQAYQQFLQGNYNLAVDLFEQEIAAYPNVIMNYWYLGLTLVLQGQEAEAQMMWMTPLLNAELEQTQVWTNELVTVLQTEVERQRDLSGTLAEKEDNQHLRTAWAICQHIREIDTENVFNLLQLLQLSLELDNPSDRVQILEQIIDSLRSSPPSTISGSLVPQVLQQLLDSFPIPLLTFQFARVCLEVDFISAESLFDMLFARMRAFGSGLPTSLVIEYGELCLSLRPDHLEVINNLINWYQTAGKNLESVKLAQTMLENSHDLVDRIAANYLINRGYMQAGGHWVEAQNAYQECINLIRDLIQLNISVEIHHILNIATMGAFAFYFDDHPQSSHQFLREFAEFAQTRIQNHFTNFQSKYFKDLALNQREPNSQAKSKVRIGYLSMCLRRHSVGWISRWLFQYHNTEQFEIYAYSLGQTDDNIQQFIANDCSMFRHVSPTISVADIAQQIREDGIDILVDLDSLTSKHCYSVLALRPAPIQITWLGMDASELPAIDYFIVDPYVLPNSADNYYTQRIWRLPQTYVAVDGFEVAVPNLRREHLGIPQDAVIYLSCQAAVKRHPDTARLQMQIINSVPNSYFLIKGGDELEVIQQFFEQIAMQEGVSCDRLRFLPNVDSEEEHRANLGIADVVLDTYPYNGATTTLETLWMNIPIVTKVGEQFAARNSYTMLINAGINEGIAWTDSEYLEWGIRFGMDLGLRQGVAWQLKQAKHTAPLWNARSFTNEMENAYMQMWQKYQGDADSSN